MTLKPFTLLWHSQSQKTCAAKEDLVVGAGGEDIVVDGKDGEDPVVAVAGVEDPKIVGAAGKDPVEDGMMARTLYLTKPVRIWK